MAVTVDIEDWYHIRLVTGSPFAKFRDVDEFFTKWNRPYDYLTEPTKRVLEILDDLNIRATFFVVADVTEHYPTLVDQIAARGHEIACHGLHHACKIHPKTKQPLISQSEFEERTMQAKKKLEQASKQKIIGYRAPAGFVAGWMLDSLEKLGFKYDSSVSVNSFYNKTDSSLRNVGTKPYYPRKSSLEPGGNREILELPWPYIKLGLKFPTGGGPLLRFLGAKYIMTGLNQSLKKGDTLIYFHPIDISNDKFPSGFSFRRPFFWLVKGERVEKRIKYILTSIPTGGHTCAEILEEYDRRH